jgi:hypothetical protein
MRHKTLLPSLATAVAAWLAAPAWAGSTHPAQSAEPFVVQIINHTVDGLCTGTVFGGTTVITTVSCITGADDRSIAWLTVTPGVHDHGSNRGPDPLPQSHYNVKRVFLTPHMAQVLKQEGFTSADEAGRVRDDSVLAVLQVEAAGHHPPLPMSPRASP